MANCGVCCSKCFTYLFIIVCFIAGVILLGGGIHILSVKITDRYADNIHHVVIAIVRVVTPALSYVFIVVGIIIIAFSVVGLGGTIKAKSWLLLSFLIAISALFVVQLGFGLHGFINSNALIENWLSETLHAGKDQELLKNAFIATQNNHRCCGVNKPTDWEIILGNKKPLDLPTTCCEWAGPGKCTVANAIPVGCKVKMNQYVQKYYIIWFALGFAVINLIQIIGILFTLVLILTFRSHDRDVRMVPGSLRRTRSNIQAFRPIALKDSK